MDKIVLDVIMKTLSDNIQVQNLLFLTVGKILSDKNDINFYLKNHDEILHIKDWITSVIENNEEWKIPRVLTIDALNNAADKYFEKKNNNLKTIEINEKDEKLIADLGNYYVVQMLTPEALDNESRVMQHCIGHGGYDEKIVDKNYQYLSLRDKFNKAHVTMEIYENKILQLQGKQNKLPDIKYLEKLLPWLVNNNYKEIPWNRIKRYYDNDTNQWIDFYKIKLIENIDFTVNRLEDCNIIYALTEKAKIFFVYIENEYTKNSKFILIDKNNEVTDYGYDLLFSINIFQELLDKKCTNIPFSEHKYLLNKNDNKIYSIFDIPDNCETDDFLDLSYFDIKKLPNNLVVNKDLYLSYCENLQNLSDNLVVNGILDLHHSSLKKLPKNLTVSRLNVSETKIKEIPDDIKIHIMLNIRNSNIKKLPDNLKCKRIYINRKNISLIKETMDFEIIYFDYMKYTKQEFFSNLSFSIK